MSVPSTSALREVAAVSEGAAGNRRRREIPGWLIPIIVYTAIFAGQIVVWVAGRLSWRNALRLARRITLWVEPLTRQRRHANLKLLFQASRRTDDQLREVDEAHLNYLARMRAEVARSMHLAREWFDEKVTLEGEKHLQDILALRHGALLVSGHTATWWLVPAILALKGYPVTAVFTPIKFPKLERMLLALTKRFNVRIAFVGRDAYKAARQAIERNEILYLTFDVAVRRHRSRYFPFGNGKLQVDPGPAVMAVRNSMPVLQATCEHLENERHQISFYHPTSIEIDPHSTDPEELCRLWTQRLEKEVQLHPEQWWPLGYVELVKNEPAHR